MLIKEYLDDKIMKNMVLPRAKSLFNKSENIKVSEVLLTLAARYNMGYINPNLDVPTTCYFTGN